MKEDGNFGFKYPGKLEIAKRFRRKDYKGGTKIKGNRRAWEFIAWDGEGTAVEEPMFVPAAPIPLWYSKSEGMIRDYKAVPQPYVLLSNSKDMHISREEGLSTYECLEFLLSTKEAYPKSIFVGFGFNYDVNQILKDLPETCLWDIYNRNITHVGGYTIRWRPGKEFYVKHGNTKRSAILYDVIGFFQSSFITMCEKYLGKDHPSLVLIREGKGARETFTWNELDEFILPYNMMEVRMLVEVMNLFRADLHSAGIYPSKWHGPGAVANEAFKKFGVVPVRTTPEEVLDAAQYAYAGGRFEHFQLGRYVGRVYEYDIHSAYPEAATKLPNIAEGHWEHVENFEPESFGVWNICFRSRDGWKGDIPQPLFCRSKGDTISYPREVSGWYWTPEAELVASDVRDGWVFRSTTTPPSRPFGFIEDLYEQRRVLKDQGSTTERAVKLIMNCLYGKKAQTVGWDEKHMLPPTHHQFEYAGYITSYTRAKIYRAMMQNPGAIIAAETDAVFSTEPLDLDIGEGLGQWELKVFDDILYLQSGFYYAHQGEKLTCKYRGMDGEGDPKQPAGLPYRKVLDHLGYISTPRPDNLYRTPPLFTVTTRFVGLGLGLTTKSVWRSWEKNHKTIHLDKDPWGAKRVHIAHECPKCQAGFTLVDCLHPMSIGGYSGQSYRRSLPWRNHKPELEEERDEPWERWEADPSMAAMTAQLYKWQDD